MKVDAVVLAGAMNQGALREESSAEYEALIDVAGRPIIDYVLQALLSSQYIDRVVVVGPDSLEVLINDKRITVTPHGASLAENIKLGLAHLSRTEKKVLLVTADIPLLTAEAVEDFLRRCEREDAAIYYPIVSKEANESAYPGVRRTYVRLREGVYTGGNLVLLAPEVIDRSYAILEKAIAMRKKPAQLARLLGLRFILKLVLHRLTIPEIERQAERILGFKGVAICSPYPDIGIDVDKPSDLELVRKALGQKAEDGRIRESVELSR